MAFCSDLCQGLRGNMRECMTTPLTRKKMIIIGGIVIFVILFIIILVVSLPSSGAVTPPKGSQVVVDVPLVVGSNGVAYMLKSDFQNQINGVDFKGKLDGNTVEDEKAKMVGVQIWMIGASKCQDSSYKDAFAQAIEQLDTLKRFLAKSGSTYLTDSGQLTSAKPGGAVGLIALDGAYALDSRPSAIRVFYDLGVRILSLNDFGGNCSPPWMKGRIPSPEFGLNIIKEANRLGMILDLSGTSYETQQFVLDRSTAPVIFSSSGYANIVEDKNYNIGNDTLKKVTAKNGLVMVTMKKDLICKDTKNCLTSNVVDAFNDMKIHLKAENFGIGGGFGYKGAEYAISGANAFRELFDSLLSKNIFSYEELKKVASLNFINLFKSVESKKNSTALPLEDFEPEKDFDQTMLTCYTDFKERYPGPATPVPAPTPVPSSTAPTSLPPSTTLPPPTSTSAPVTTPPPKP